MRTTANTVKQMVALYEAVEDPNLAESLQDWLHDTGGILADITTAVTVMDKLKGISRDLSKAGYDVDWDVIGYFAAATCNDD